MKQKLLDLKGHVLAFVLLLIAFGMGTSIQAQVNVTATAGTLAGSYTTLKGAFDAINAGTHQGIITIDITASTTETLPAVLHSSGAGSALYTSVLIQPANDNVQIGGATATGRGLIEFNGADNVTINGDNPNTGGTNRNLTLVNTADSTITYTSVVRVALNTTTVSSGNNITIRNCIIIGSARNRNDPAVTTTTSSANASWGIVVSGGVVGATSAPSALTSLITTTGTTASLLNFIVENNQIHSVGRAISIGTSGATIANGLQIVNNQIGQANAQSSVYSIGIAFGGSSNAIIRGNTIQNVQSYLATAIRGIDFGVISTSGGGALMENNIITQVINNNPSTYGAYGITMSGGNGHTIRNNFIANVRNDQTSGTGGFSTTDGVFGIRIGGGNSHVVVHNSVHFSGVLPGSTSTNLLACIGLTSASTNTACDVRNNIFSNQLTGGNPAGTRLVCIYLPSGATSTMNLTLNNNAYYLSTDPNARLAQTGTTFGAGEYAMADFVPSAITPAANFRSYSSALSLAGTNDNKSFGLSSAPPFVSNTNLHVPAATLTKLESGGATVGLTTDIDADNRPGPTGSVNGGATAPDIGADEFDGIPISVDIGVVLLISPNATGCPSATDSIRVRVQNFTADPINLVTDSIIINGFSSGVNPVVFPQRVLNTGILAGNGTIDVTLYTGYNLTLAGTHTFKAWADINGDNFAINDTLAPVSIVQSGGIATANVLDICQGSTATLSLSGYTPGATFQWQSSPDGSSWTNLVGGTVTPFNVGPTDTTYYRALVCGSLVSVVDTVNVITVTSPTSSNVTRCGPGTVQLSASGVGTLNWFDAPTGGTLLGSGSTFTTPFLTSNTTFYVSASSGSGVSPVGAPNNGSTGNYTLEAGLFFDVFTSNITIQGVYVYPVGTGAGTVDIALKNSSGVNLQTLTVNLVGTTAPGIQTYVPLNFNVPQGTGYSLVMLSRSGGVASLTRDVSGSITGGGYPFTLPGVMSITSGRCCPSAVSTAYYYFYNWQVTTPCQSPRTPVAVTLTPSDSIVATAVTNPLCTNQQSAINITSNNTNYQYTWTPATGLNTTSGGSVITDADSTITYTISALDPSTNCAAYTSIQINVLPIPSLSVTPGDTVLCVNEQAQLLSTAGGSDPFVVIGSGTTSNTATSTTILGPYGGYYGGARHQYLYTATELQAAGLSAGIIDYLSFEVTALNGSGALADYTIKMDTTSATALTTTFNTSLPTVYFNASYVPANGWNTHNIAAFNWDGVSNILVEVCFNNQNSGYSNGNASVRYTATTGTNTVTYYRADNDPNVCVTGTGTASVNRPNIRFGRVAPLDYTWTPAAGLNSDTIAGPILTAVSTLDYVITVTDELNGCSNSDTVEVIARPLPVVFIGNDTTLCSNNTNGFFLDATNPDWSQNWQDGSTSPTFLVTSPGLYWVAVTDTNGCVGVDSIEVVPVNPIPVSIDVNLTSTTTATLDAGPGFIGYTWNNFQTTQTININSNGTYYVQAVDINNCTSTDTITIVFSLDVEQPGAGLSSVQYYPNPSDGWVNMKVTGVTPGTELYMEILDIQGRKVYSQSFTSASDEWTTALDLRGLTNGTYLVRLSNGSSIHAGRIVIQH